jgi:hypothetical protein
MVALKPSSPFYFQNFLARRWAEGDKVGRRLFHEIKRRGYRAAFLIWSAFCPQDRPSEGIC